MRTSRLPTRTVARAVALAAVAAALLLALPLSAQDSREAERKLERIRGELKSVAAERRQLEGQRGDASRQLRDADEKVGNSTRTLRETETQLARDQAKLAELQKRRGAMHARLGARRDELARLVRAAYAQGGSAPLKALLAQDRVADASRLLTYHGYVQRDRASRIAVLTQELRAMETLERAIAARQQQLVGARAQQRSQIGQLESDRKGRVALMARIDAQYQDRSSREKALGRDAQGLEKLLRQLRVAAAREAKRRAVAAAKAEKAARSPVGVGKQGAATRSATRAPAPARARAAAKVASGPALQVGGLGWPASGALLAGFGGRMPDGRSSDGLLIGAGAGSPVKAVADGQVVYAEWMTGYGLLLIVDHGNGYMSLYAHNDALLKDVGAAVKRGESLGTVGSSGGQGRPALYFELRRNGAPVNPGTWLRH